MDLSLETHNETEDSFVQKSGEPIINLLGTIEIGYTIKNTSVFVRHTSSVQQVDIGLNVIGIKFRVI